MPAKYGGGRLTCDAYSQIRQGLDPELVNTDRLRFLRKVQLVRAELER